MAESLGDDGRRGRVAAALSNTLFTKGRLDRALETATHALRLGEAHADLALRVSAHVRLEAIHQATGKDRVIEIAV